MIIAEARTRRAATATCWAAVAVLCATLGLAMAGEPGIDWSKTAHSTLPVKLATHAGRVS